MRRWLDDNFAWLVLAVVVILVCIHVWANWTVCNGDIVCFVVGPKYVVVQQVK